MTTLHILLDSQEQSISAARKYCQDLKPLPDFQVQHVRHKNFAATFMNLVNQVTSGDQILISMDYISPVELKSVSDQLSVGGNICKEKNLIVELISFVCFKHIKNWCGAPNKFKFIDNRFKRRELKKDAKENIRNYLKINSKTSLTDVEKKILERIWIQYRLMLAIISKQRLDDVATELIKQQPSKEEFSRAFRFFTLREPDMVGGTYFGETGNGNVIDQLRKRIKLIVATDFHVLIQGESGSGKEAIAWAIHELSDRRDKPFLTLNCASFSEQLLESELFGHKKGAFTDAVTSHDGILKEADGGTVFLDELPEMEPRVQAKLLRLLESGEYRPVGDERESLYVDVRIVGAGQGNLLNDPARIRPDLKARIAQLTVQLSPLRNLDKETLLKICNALLVRYTWTTVDRVGKKHELTPLDIRKYQDSLMGNTKYQELLVSAQWKESNVRELNNFIRHWLVFGEKETFDRLSSSNRGSSEENAQTGMASSSPQANAYGDFGKYLNSFTNQDELAEMFPGKFFDNIKSAYAQYIFERYQKIDTQGVKKSRKHLSSLIKITEHKLGNYLNPPKTKGDKDPVL
jgi:DNA-binding NtrC family response regulator